MPLFVKPSRVAMLAGLAVLAGCSEYTDRRDLISIHGGDAVDSTKVGMMVDPWPRYAADRNIAYNGVLMQSAYERYRSGKVVRPVGMGTSSTYEQPQQPSNGSSNNNTPVGPTVTQATSVK
jgi:hypothetical protein